VTRRRRNERLESNVRNGFSMGSVIKKRRKRMAKKKHRKLLRKTRVARRKAGK
jgi:hypothetical protein